MVRSMKSTGKKTMPRDTLTGTQKRRGKRIGRLKTPSDVARFMARCVRSATREGGSDAATVNHYYKLSLMSAMLLRAVEVADLEARLLRVEQSLKGK